MLKSFSTSRPTGSTGETMLRGALLGFKIEISERSKCATKYIKIKLIEDGLQFTQQVRHSTTI